MDIKSFINDVIFILTFQFLLFLLKDNNNTCVEGVIFFIYCSPVTNRYDNKFIDFFNNFLKFY